MPLELVVGPAHAGKVALLLDRYLTRIGEEPLLIVPNRLDVDRAERDLLARCGCLIGGSIGTFDDLFERLAAGDRDRRPLIGDAQRALAVRRAVNMVRQEGATELSRSSRFGGFADELLVAVAELESGLVDPAKLDGELAALHTAYRSILDRLGLWDRDIMRRRGSERLLGDLTAWHGEPVFAYGFEDLTAAEWSLLEALAGRADVTVSLPYEPGRAAFASLRRTAEDLAALADGRIEELPAAATVNLPPAIAHLERSLFETATAAPVPPGLHGEIRFLEGAGVRGLLELVGEEVLSLLRGGVAAEEIALVLPAVERSRAAIETVFSSLGIPFGLESRLRLPATPFGQALIGLLRFAWADGGRRELFSFLRSPYSGLGRTAVDFVEGRLRGRAITEPDRVESESERLREAPLVPLRALRDAPSPIDGVRALLDSMARSAYGVEAPPAGEQSRSDLRCLSAVATLLDELEGWQRLGERVETDDLIATLERADVAATRPAEPGRVAVLDLRRARTRRFRAVFLLGLEEGSLPRRGGGSPFLDDDRRRSLGARLERPDAVSRDRYLFYTACTRATERLYLAREAASDDGSPRQASPFWDDVAAVFDPEEVARATQRRPLSHLTWTVDAAPTDRERLRALARLAADPADLDLANALADSNGWDRRLRRARRAFSREPRLRDAVVLEQFSSRTTFAATELERFVDCSSAWLFERVIRPRKIDAEADALLRGSIAHQALYAFYSGLPKELGVERIDPSTLTVGLRYLARCLDEAIGGGARLDLGPVDAAELREGLWHDLDRFLRDEAASGLAFAPRRFEIGFGTDRSAPELQRGLQLGDGLALSGKIDRIDIDPFSARGIVQDYKTGKSTFSAKQIDDEHRLQIPLYMLVLRDLVGIEPLGGVYRALAGARVARGMLREDARDELPGFASNDFLDDERFWEQVETARERAKAAAVRIRQGEVKHDPRGGECPSWCDVWTMCRVARS